MLQPLKAIPDIDEKDLFAASYVKLARAQHFIEELKAEAERYKNSDPISVRLDPKANPPSIEVHWKGVTLLPGAIIGDAVHNLRTSLDLMASELARINGKSDDGVYFPFAASADRFDQAIKSRNFHKAGDDAVALLRKFAPYRGGNDRLRALHDLDIQDKHTALVPMGQDRNIEVAGSYNVDDLTQNTLTVVSHHTQYIFPADGILGGDGIIETLEALLQLVHGIVEAFAGLVRSPS
jgi:hypothetical protein